MVHTSDLTKAYGDFVAVDRLNFSVREGDIFGLLGPNGAGKTTTILMLLGLTEPTAGTMRVCGFNSTRDPLNVKRIVGYLPENVGFYEELTGRENLQYTARLNGIPAQEAERRIESSLAQVGMLEAADKKAGQFSRGMRQRLGIADVLLKNPRLVILDEPTLGLDPDGVNQLLDLIVRMSRQQKITVMLSSHQLHQVQQICDRVGIFVKGRMVAEGNIEELWKQTLKGRRLIIEVQAVPQGQQTVTALQGIEGVEAVERSGEMLLLSCNRDVRDKIAKAVGDAGAALLHLRLLEHGLEDIYFKYFREG
ncbi:MAG: ABC transporter ATP-binding protein [Chloroflexi bacterium]|nr:ABC transporter ATP-binding protein [Chloroflexota bacterium]